MGVATGIAIAGAAVAVAGGVSKAVKGGKQKRAAKRAIKGFKRQKLENVQKDRRISTRGAEVQLEQQARNAATSLEVLASGGIRGAVGGVGAVQGQNNAVAQQVGAGLDQQAVNIEREAAIDEARIRAMKESRDNQELNQMFSQLNAGEQNIASGYGDIAQAGMSMASMGAGKSGGAGGAAGGVNATQGVAAPSQFAINPQSQAALNAPVTQSIPAFGQPAPSFVGQYVNNPYQFGAINPQTGQPY